MSNPAPKLHNAMWPGLVGKASMEGSEPDVDFDTMLNMTAAAKVDGVRFDGVDLFLRHPHPDIDIDDDGLKALAEKVQGKGLVIGSVVPPVWFFGNAMGSEEQRKGWVDCVRKGIQIAARLRELGVRPYGGVRIDSNANVREFNTNPSTNTQLIAATFKEAGKIAAHKGERLFAEGEVCWGGMHSWKQMLATLEATGMPQIVGFQADLAHTYLYLLGLNAPSSHALLKEGYSSEEFDIAYKTMTDALLPWTFDFHVAQNDGTVLGSGSHDKTGRHCQADDPNGKLDIVKASGYWLSGAAERGIEHICWDGCLFPNSVLLDQGTWNTVLATMLKVRNAHGWN